MKSLLKKSRDRISRLPKGYKIFLGFFFSLLLLLILGYIYIAYFLPLPDELTAPQNLPSTKIFDRNGILLYEVLNPKEGRKTYLSLNQIPQTFIQATLSAEDADFYNHIGVDFTAIFRALIFNTVEQRITSGASTITQQLVRNLLHTNRQRSLKDKIIEAAYAIRISNVYDKNQILEKYLNTVYYGNLAYGAQTAALNYFGKNLSDLDLAQQTLLAGLPQSPSTYNPFENLSVAQKRQKYVLDQMVKNNYITQKQDDQAATESITLQPAGPNNLAPHFVQHILNELTELYGQDAVNFGGLQVKTTLDLNQNQNTEAIINRQLDKLSKKNVTNGAALAIDKNTGQIIVWVGSRNFNDPKIAGQVDIINAFRQPGSALKPFLYLQAFEQLHYTPATIIPDLPFAYQTENGLYTPQNYDLDFHGPVRVREALANSYNIPAVRTLDKVGITNFLNFLRSFGLTSLDKPSEYYGLSLTLGGGEVQLYQMVRAYDALANLGYYQNLSDLLEVDAPSSVIPGADPGSGVSYAPIYQWQRPQKNNLLGSTGQQDSWLISSIISDPNSRLEEFGEGNVLELTFPAAAKTGTTRNFNDNWTFGFSSRIVAGVWVGNSDSSPMQNVSGIDGAGPIWHDLMESLNQHFTSAAPGTDPGSTNPLPRPKNIIALDICKLSGLLVSPLCPDHLHEYFLKGTEPKIPDNWYFLCHPELVEHPALAVGSGSSVGSVKTQSVYITYPVDYYKWAQDRNLLPPDSCHPELGSGPTSGLSSSALSSFVIPESTPSVVILSPLSHDSYQLDPNIPLNSQKIIIKYQVNQPLQSLSILIDGNSLPDSIPGGNAEIDPQISSYSWLPTRGQHRLIIKATNPDQTEYTTPDISFEIN